MLGRAASAAECFSLQDSDPQVNPDRIWTIRNALPYGLSVILAVCDVPFNAAVIVAVAVEEIVPAVAVNVPEVAPEGMVIEAGTVSDELLLDTATVAPAAVAA